ncbi:uncharacterized protein LOC131029660 isoform X2 [Cryptomeria japonica]|uniref:uncharacterized protein LOC131029660 isoform X2 n=1 Tax=Cryptomeria japonica TaxID=3369 RepID=UPI0027DA40EA|nr:uncharacterized protein LOC131029660 isoform X2 [Cryptomeria japonica]
MHGQQVELKKRNFQHSSSCMSKVRVCIKQNCEPLPESAFRNAISENYYSDKHFWFELNHAQTDALMSLFHPRLNKRSEMDFPKSSENGVWSSQRSQSSSDGCQIAPVRTSVDYADIGSEGIDLEEWPVVSQKGKEIPYRKGNSWEETGESSRKNKENSKSRASSHSSFGQSSEDTFTINSDDEKTAARELTKGKTSPILHGNGPESTGQVSILNYPITNMSNEDRVLEKLKQLAIHRQNSSKHPIPDLSTKGLNDNMNSHFGNDEEKSMDDKLRSDQASLKAEREIFVCGLRSVDTILADNLQNYLEQQDLSIVQMRQEITELRSCGKKTHAALGQMQQEITELRSCGKNTYDDSQHAEKFQVLEQRQTSMETEIQTLKEQVKRLEQLLEGREVNIALDELADISNHEEPKLPSIFLLGGYNGDQDLWLNTLDGYSPRTDTIKSLAPMPSVRSYAAATILDNSIYVFGGGNGSLWYNSVERYDQESDSWTTCPSMNLCRGSLAGASLDGKLFALGGGNGAEYFSDVEMFDRFLGSWISYGTMLQKRFALAGTVLGGALYALGGFDGRQYLKSVERFDPREGHWVQLEEMNWKRGSLSAAVLNEKLYAIGGFDGSKLLSSVEVFDPRAGSWLVVDNIASPRGYGATAVLEDSIYLIGGIAEGGYHQSVECYNDGSGWEVLYSTAVGKRSFLAAVVL